MSTNYYFVEKASDLAANTHNAKVDVIFNLAKSSLEKLGFELPYIEQKSFSWEDPFLKSHNEIHIGKCSAGWKPLFQTSSEYTSVDGMKKWYEENQAEYSIKNEYGETLTWTELESELITWDGKNSHVETMKKNYPSMAFDYFVVDGYEFTTRDFS